MKSRGFAGDLVLAVACISTAVVLGGGVLVAAAVEPTSKGLTRTQLPTLLEAPVATQHVVLPELREPVSVSSVAIAEAPVPFEGDRGPVEPCRDVQGHYTCPSDPVAFEGDLGPILRCGADYVVGECTWQRNDGEVP